MAEQESPKPPVARRVPRVLVAHGHERIDEYYWLRDRNNPGVIEYLEAENRYTSEMMKHTEDLQRKLFEELRARNKDTDTSVPERIDDFFYYYRTEADKQYQIHCRKKGSQEAEEEIILDLNVVASGNTFFKVSMVKVSPNHNRLTYLADMDGSERYTLFVKDLTTGKMLQDQIRNTHDVEWANDSTTIFYSTMDKEYRPDKVWKHVLGSDPKSDVLVFHEEDPAFYYLEVTKTKSRKFLLITIESATTSEVRYLPADATDESFRLFRPRKHMVEYFVLHLGHTFYVVTNEDAINFKIMTVPDDNIARENWSELIPHRGDVVIDVSDPNPWVEPFEKSLVVFERQNAQGKIRIYSLDDMSLHTIDFGEQVYFVMPVTNQNPDSNKLRVRYWSLVTPTREYEYDLESRKLRLLKEDDIPGYDPDKYTAHMTWATSEDGVKVPVSIVHMKGLRKDGKNPCYLYAYGAYATFEWATSGFNTNLVSLLERGFVCAYAHIRGGGDMGRKWHHDGRLLSKINTFNDFIACAEHLVKEGYTSPKKLAIRGRSAGGLLMGVVTNMRPDLFKAVVAEVPFVDGITTMLDPTIPLTVGEFEEWGNPAEKEHYDYIKKYSPYDNVARKAYPNMLVTAGLNDSRVGYWEPAKWIAKLRAMRTDDNLLLFRVGIVEGHAGASGRYDHLKWFACMYAFILDRLGVT
ncbi:MAG: oligopeptidase B [Euryarchaeota archaeon RBG_13_57_23]|nr:MAG: oligopeptidase B [Euryarchaeota archaeon RBG_13_57_23]